MLNKVYSDSKYQSTLANIFTQPKYSLIILFVIAFIIRIIGADWGYINFDERINDAAKVLTGQLVPGQHFYPPFINYVNAIGFGVLFVFGKLLGVWPDTAAFRAQYFADPTPFYVTARYIMAAFGALAAPVFYLIARRLKLPVWQSWAVGLMGVLIPITVYMSHIAKGDTALATFHVVAILALIMRHQSPGSVRADLLIGLATILAMSFKHSYLFVLVPLIIVHGILLWRNEGLKALGKSFLISLAVALVLMPLLNIGILLDLSNFIEYQKIQSVMSIRESHSFIDAALLLVESTISSIRGINPIAAALSVIFPIYLLSPLCKLPNKPLLAGIWIANALSLLVMLDIVGARQPDHLWMAQVIVMQLMAALLLADLSRHSFRAVSVAATIVMAGCIIWSAAGSVEIGRQALATPAAREVEKILLERYRNHKILTMVPLGKLPRKKAIYAYENERLKRLARKYKVELPKRHPERAIEVEDPNAMYIIGMPMVMWGLEGSDDSQMDGIVKAHAWPPQEEEWQLDYWLGRGVDLVVVGNFEDYQTVESSEIYRKFFGELGRRCKIVYEVEPVKPLLISTKLISILDCGPSS
jgi:4-amino-4-deoxy-L-arabinose transferase-like glycosyltransferase